MALVMDEESGIAYEGYNAELIRAFLILLHYTDMELAEYDTPEGRHEIYDMIASHDLWKEIMKIVDDDLGDVDSICYRLMCSAKRNFEQKHSLAYKVGRVFESLLGTENLADTIAHAEGLNSKLIDMLSALQKEQKPTELGGMRFAKKETQLSK